MNYRALYFTPNYGTFITISPTRISVLSNFTAECFFKDNGTSCQYINILQKRRPDVRYEEYVDSEDGTVTTNTTYANGMSLWFMSVGASSLRIRADSVPESGVKPNNGCNWNQGADCTTSIKDGKWPHAYLGEIRKGPKNMLLLKTCPLAGGDWRIGLGVLDCRGFGLGAAPPMPRSAPRRR